MRATALAASAGSEGGVPLLRLERLMYRFVAAGFVVLSAAIALGAWDARPWRWDHKAVFSILGWLVFAGLLAGRRAFGWRGPKATGWLYAGAGLLLLAYVGLALRARGAAASAAERLSRDDEDPALPDRGRHPALAAARRDEPAQRRSRARPGEPRRRRAAADRRLRPLRRCTCRATRRCPGGAASSAARRTASRTRRRIRAARDVRPPRPVPSPRPGGRGPVVVTRLAHRARSAIRRRGDAVRANRGSARSRRPARRRRCSTIRASPPPGRPMPTPSSRVWPKGGARRRRHGVRAHLPGLHRARGPPSAWRPGHDAAVAGAVRGAADAAGCGAEHRLRGAGDQHVAVAAISRRRASRGSWRACAARSGWRRSAPTWCCFTGLHIALAGIELQLRRAAGDAGADGRRAHAAPAGARDGGGGDASPCSSPPGWACSRAATSLC